jgi:hypothetical protein
VDCLVFEQDWAGCIMERANRPAWRDDRAAPGSRLRAHPLRGLLRSLAYPFRLRRPGAALRAGLSFRRRKLKPRGASAACIQEGLLLFDATRSFSHSRAARTSCACGLWPFAPLSAALRPDFRATGNPACNRYLDHDFEPTFRATSQWRLLAGQR